MIGRDQPKQIEACIEGPHALIYCMDSISLSGRLRILGMVRRSVQCYRYSSVFASSVMSHVSHIRGIFSLLPATPTTS